MFRRVCIILCWGILFNADCFAEDVRFEVTVDRNRVSLGGSIQLNLNFYGTQNVATPYFPGVDGFDWRYSGPSSLTSIINGEVSSSITHRYRLVALREGSFVIPSFSIQYRGKTYTSEPIRVEVVRGLAGPFQAGQGKIAAEPENLEDRVFLVVEADKSKAYVNEIIPVRIKLYAHRLAIKDIQFPKFTHEGFFADEFAQPRQYQESVRGVLHNVIEFETNVFAVRAGKLKLGPSQLGCNLLIKEGSSRRRRPFFFDFGFDDDFFARYTTYPLHLKAVEVPVTILALPEEGKPDDFSGALGIYSFSVTTDVREVKVGDPITLKMRIRGEGNIKSVNPPALNFGDDFKVYEPEVRQETSGKTFEQVIIPTNDKINEIPRINFSFFDSESGHYQQITQGPIPIKVKPLPKGEKLKVFEVAAEGRGPRRKREILGRDIIYIKDTPGELKRKGLLLCKNRLFIVLQFLPLAALIAVLIFQKRKERLQSDIGYARRLRANGEAKKNLRKLRRLLDSKEPAEFFDAVFKALQEYLGDKFHLPTAGITVNVVDELKGRNIEDEILDKIQECFAACDMARYAVSSVTKNEMLNALKLLEEIIDRLERIRV